MKCANCEKNEATTVWIHREPVCQNCHNALVNHALLLLPPHIPTVEQFKEWGKRLWKDTT